MIFKIFIVVLVFKVIEENKLSLNEIIDSFFLEIRNVNKIMIEYLLYYRSGVYSFIDDMKKYLSYYI